MILEIATPASLFLGLIEAADGPALLTLAVQHPPVQLYAQAQRRLHITGPRAHIAHAHALRFLQHHRLSRLGEIEIELAIPAFMGLNGDAMLGLATAQALAWAHDLPDWKSVPQLAAALGLPPSRNGEIAAYQAGGLTLTGMRHPAEHRVPVLRRAEIAHPERDAWAFVLYFPQPPENTPETYEDERLQTCLQTGAPAPASLAEDIFAAVQNNDLAAFGQGLMSLRQRTPHSVAQDSQAILDLMGQSGAFAWGQCLTGYGLWALVKGGDASRALRKKISDHVGFFGGRVMATITDNRGALWVEKPGELGVKDPIRPRPGVS